MPEFPKIGNKVVAKVIGSKGKCTIGLKEGDEFELSIHRCGDFCGYFYHNIFHWIVMLQFGGVFPLSEDKDVIVCECPNPQNRMKVELRRVKE